MQPCIFCEILAGRAPASFVFQDDVVAAFMTRRPTRPGELLVIPRAHIDHFTDLDDATTAHVALVAQRLSRRVRERLAPLRVGWVVHGFGVAHAHLVVVPQHHELDITSARHPILEETERAELDRLAQLLAAP